MTKVAQQHSPPSIKKKHVGDHQGKVRKKAVKGDHDAHQNISKNKLESLQAPKGKRKRKRSPSNLSDTGKSSKGSKVGKSTTKKSKKMVEKPARPWSRKIWPINAQFWSKLAGYNSRLGMPLDEVPFSVHIRAVEFVHSDKAKSYGQQYYEVYREEGASLYFAAEKSFCSGGSRPFQLTFLDMGDNVVMRMERNKSLKLCCCGAKLLGSDATLYDDQNNIVGEIKQEWRCGVLRFNLNLPGLPGKKNIVIAGPNLHVCCLSYIGDDATFEVFSVEENESGVAEQTRIGIYRLYATPRPFVSGQPPVLRLETRIETSEEFQWVLVGVGALLHLSYFEENPGEFADCYGGCCITQIVCCLLIVVILLAVFLGAFFLPGGISDFKALIFDTSMADSVTFQPTTTSSSSTASGMTPSAPSTS